VDAVIKADAQGMRAAVQGVVADLRWRLGLLKTTVRVTVSPDDARNDGVSNTAVAGHLSRHSPRWLALGPDLDDAMSKAAWGAWRPWRMTMKGLAPYIGTALARGLAARLRSGRFVTNTPETLARKRARGRPAIPGVDTEQLARALDGATIRVTE
jgi:hypothetical protein